MTRAVESEEGRRSAIVTPSITIAFIGVISILLLWLGQATITGRTVRDMRVSETLTEIELGASLAHVWLEEALQGDADIDMRADVLRRIVDASRNAATLRQILDEQLDSDPTVTRRLVRIQTHLETMQRLVPERQVLGSKSGAGSLLDLQFDAAFNSLLADATLVRQTVASAVPLHQARSRRWMLTIIGLWLCALIVALLTLAAQHRRLQQAHAAALIGERRLATILGSIGEGIVAIGKSGEIAFMNRVASQITGADQERALGKPLESIWPAVREEDSRSSAFSVGRRGGSGRPMEAGEMTVTNTLGEERIIEQARAPMSDPRGQEEGSVLILRDITERRRNEAALRDQEARLMQAQKLDAVGRLAGGVAHDINNYLGAIGANCASLKITYRDDARVVETMRHVGEIVDHASAFLRRLLVFTREHKSDSIPTDINFAIREVARMVGSVIPATINMEFDLDSEACIATLDPSLFEQVVVNLIVNARDALPGGGTITIRTRRVTVSPQEAPRGLAQDWIELQISDNGIGIPELIRGQILEPFFTTKRTMGCSGLGLSTVNSAVTQAGGSLQIASEVGKGTTIVVRLPRVEVERHADATLPAAHATAGNLGLRILVVEDNEVMRTSLGGLLVALGHSATTANDGESGLKAFFEYGPFDLVITDVVMPRCSGRDLAQQVWRYDPSTKFLFMSGYSEPDQVSDLLADQRAVFLSKPFHECALCTAIESLRSPSSE